MISSFLYLDKFLNGLLRNVCRNKEKILQELSLKDNIPHWIKSDIIKNLGEDVLNEISKTIISEPFLDIKIKNNYLNNFVTKRGLFFRRFFVLFFSAFVRT